jgi:hypothetical protein
MGQGGATSPRRDPVLIGLAVGAVLTIAWFVADLATPVAQARVYWLLQPPLDFLIAAFSWRTARSERLSRPARRFFGALAFMGLAYAVGDTGQVIHVLGEAEPQIAPGPFQSAFFAIGLCAVLVIMLAYPTAAANARERLRFWIDAITVLVGAAVVVWASVASSADLANSLIVGALVMCVVFAASKLLLAGNAPMTRQAALPTVLAPFVQGLALLLMGTLGRHQPHLQYALQIVPSFLVVAGLA